MAPAPEQESPRERESGLERLEHRLYSRTPPPLRHDEEFIGEEKHVRIAPEWTSEAERKESAFYSIAATAMPWLKRLLIASVLFFMFTVGIAFYGVWRGGNTVSPQNISVELRGPVGVGAGEEMSLEIAVRNGNAIDLASVDLLVEFPDSTRKQGSLEESLLRYRDALGEIPAGNAASRKLFFVPFGEEGEQQTIRVTVEYRPRDSNAIFSKKTEHTFAINSAPVLFTLEIPKEVNADQTFEVTIDLRSNSSVVQENLLVKAEYPFGFQFVQSSPEPSFGKDTWLVGDLPPQGTRTLVIKGKLQATEKEERTFRFSLGTQSIKDEKQLSTVFLSEMSSILIQKPFILLDLLVNGKEGKTFVGRSGQTVRADITWVNNLAAKVANLELTAKLSGDIYNKATVSAANGSYDSTAGTILWDQRKMVQFAAVEPGKDGTVSFSFTMLPLAASAASLKNPQMTIEVTARGKRLDEQGLYQDVVSSVQKDIKVATVLALSVRLLHDDGPFANSGPIPPKAEQETTYTVVWSLSNASNGVANTKVSAVLPAYVKWLGDINLPSERITYSPVGGEVVWDVGDIAADTGIRTPPREVSFRVSFLPSLNHVGTAPTVVEESVARGTDRFTGVEVSSNIRPALTTQMLGDPRAAEASGIVTR